MNKKTNDFIETDIFRTSSLLLREVFVRVKNMELDVKRTVGDKLMNEISQCVEYCKLSWVEQKDNRKMKLVYMILAKHEINKSEVNLNLIVSAGLFGKNKKSNESNEMYLNGGSEISKHMGMLIIQLDSMISSLEKDFNEEELNNIYELINLYFIKK